MKCLSGIMGLLIVMGGAGAGWAEEPSAAAEKAKQQAEASAKLAGTEWAVECMPMSGEKLKKPMQDTLKFQQGKLTSAMLTKDGYVSSNYTLTVGDDAIPVWETMQAHPEKGNAFWRGELHGDTMSGILSRHPLEGPAQDYSFLGHQSGTVSTDEAAFSVPPPAVKPAQPRPTAPAASAATAIRAERSAGRGGRPAAAPAAQTTPKKKSWFGR